MCGIAGLYRTSSQPIASEHLVSMAHAIVHRGPDGQGVWQSSDGQCGFVHRRLAIIDLSPSGAQPMHDSDGIVSITFNGEIYNYREIRTELIARGHRFRTESDTEVILEAYKEWGIACLDRFEGMFAFALYDHRSRGLFLVRDRFGVKPLYITMQQGFLAFASEIKAFWQLPGVVQKISGTALEQYLTYLMAPAPLTMFEGVYKIPAGFYLHCTPNGTMVAHAWYSPLRASVFDPARRESDLVDELDYLMASSVKKRLVADVEVGVFLSGGVDSSLLVAYASRHAHGLKTFHISSEGTPDDELVYAQRVATQYGAQLFATTMNESDAAAVSRAIAFHHDEPLADCVSVPLYYVSKLAREQGITVGLLGEAADELLCGYRLYAQYHKLQPWFASTQRMLPRPIRAAAGRVLYPLLSSRPTHRDALDQWVAGKPLFWGGARVFLPSKIVHWPEDLSGKASVETSSMLGLFYPHLNGPFTVHSFIEYHRAQLFAAWPHADTLQMITYLELKHRLPELLLMRADKMTMAHGLEGREPYLDRALVEFCFALPARYKIRDGVTKYLMKKVAERYLPHDLIYRKKVGFSAPTKRWFAHQGPIMHQLNGLIDDIHSPVHARISRAAVRTLLSASQATNAYADQLWTLFSLYSTFSRDRMSAS